MLVFCLFTGMISGQSSTTDSSLNSGTTVPDAADTLQADRKIFDELKKIQKVNPKSIEVLANNSGRKGSVNKVVKNIINQELTHSKEVYLQHKEVLEQSRSFVKIISECEQANFLLKEGFNYKLANNQIKLFDDWKNTCVKGILTQRNKIQTTRDLTITSILLNEILRKTESSLKTVQDYHNELAGVQHRLDSLVKYSNVYSMPSDSTQVKSYLQRLLLMKSNLDPVNQSLKTTLDSIQRFEIQFDILKLHIQSDIAATEKIRKNLYQTLTENEIIRADQAELSRNSFEKNIDHAATKGVLVLIFYYANNSGKFLIMFVAFLFILIYLNLLKRRSKQAGLLEKINSQTKVLRNPISSAVLITLTFFQFLLPEPPFIISGIIWVISIVAFGFFLSHFVERKWFYAWLAFIALFLVMFFVNTQLLFSETERTLIYLLSIVSFVMGAIIFYRILKLNIVDKAIVTPLALMLVFELISLYFNINGSYNLSKMFMVNGIMIFVLSYLLLWCIRLITEALNISIYFQKTINDESHELLPAVFTKKLPFSLYLAMLVASMYLIYRTSFGYQSLIDPLYEYFTTKRTIGEFSFTLQSVVVFFLVMYISTLVSKIISFLTIGVESVTSKNKVKKGPGSWMLLIRIGIISSGIMLAFVAAGIPVDRLAIMISAMGVAVAFGLQTLINNLVSGLFIAIEKPINVGDFVEIAGKVGRMKSIGIRSSIITTFDGADVIIPNGDLMNQHLTNWTLGNTRRRFQISVGVAYGSDLTKVQELIYSILNQDKRIMKKPEPVVFYTQFNNSSIDFDVKFWVYHYDDGVPAMSDLIIAIDIAFKENGIEIPFPQQDLHIKDENSKKPLKIHKNPAKSVAPTSKKQGAGTFDETTGD